MSMNSHRRIRSASLSGMGGSPSPTYTPEERTGESGTRGNRLVSAANADEEGAETPGRRGGTKIPDAGTEADEATPARGGGTRFPDDEGDTEVDCTEGKDVMSAPEREAGGMNVPDRESAAGTDTIGTPTRAADNGITPKPKK